MQSMYQFPIKLNEDFGECSIKHQLMQLFVKNQNKCFRDQQEVQAELAAMGAPHSQGAISKNLRFLQQFPFKYKGRVYAICRTPKGYKLLDREDYPKSLRYVLYKEKILEKDKVFCESTAPVPLMFLLWIVDDEDKKVRAKELFKKALNGGYMDIFYIDNRLVILLDIESSSYSENSKILKDFFSETNSKYIQVDEGWIEDTE